jgi:hypothetical protein
MALLYIDLQEGFADDTVILRVNGKEVFSKKRVTKRLLLGLADSVKTEVEKGLVTIEARVETRGIAKTIRLNVSADTYVGVSVVNDKIEHLVSGKPFGYA